LVAAGHALREIERAGVHHISVGKPRLDWAALIEGRWAVHLHQGRRAVEEP
jgi:hypothetical protein